MTSFEFVFGLISVITSLALTRMLSGSVSLYRHAQRVRLSWRHGCWAATALMVLVGNWAALWTKHNATTWTTLDVLIPLVYISILYAFCDLVMPDVQGDVRMDLREYHAHEGKRYKLLQLAFATVTALALLHGASSFVDWLFRAKFAILAAVLGVIALRARRVWLDTVTAVAFTVLGASFMLASLSWLSTR